MLTVVVRHFACDVDAKLYGPTRMAELASGVIAVEDASGECDLFFNALQWRIKNCNVAGCAVKLWSNRKGSDGKRGGVKKSTDISTMRVRLECLEGSRCGVYEIEEMAGFARASLSPTDGILAWHTVPQILDFEEK